MSNRKIQMPREVYIDPGIVKDTGDICKSLHLDKKILIVTGEHTYDIGAKPVMDSLDKQGIEWDVIKVNKANYDSVNDYDGTNATVSFSYAYTGADYQYRGGNNLNNNRLLESITCSIRILG